MALRLQLLSDLHLEGDPDYTPCTQRAAETDVLVLAGDIGSLQAGSRLTADDMGLARFAPRRGAPWRHVVLVPGNHEFDGVDVDEQDAHLRRLCAEFGIHYLNRDTVTLLGHRFVGCTLWADFDAFADPKRPQESLRQRDKAFKAAHYHLRKADMRWQGEPVRAAQVRAWSLRDQDWLRHTLAQAHPEGPTVVVTHFAPSLRCADPRYGHTPGTAGFCNQLEALLTGVPLWLHGHLHCPITVDIPTPQGPCRVHANPRGYAHKNEQAHFRESAIFSLPISPDNRSL